MHKTRIYDISIAGYLHDVHEHDCGVVFLRKFSATTHEIKKILNNIMLLLENMTLLHIQLHYPDTLVYSVAIYLNPCCLVVNFKKFRAFIPTNKKLSFR